MSRTGRLVACVAVLSVAPADAQDVGRAAGPRTSFSQFVPASAGVYVEVGNLGEVNEVLHRVHAWEWLPRLLGVASRNAFPADLQQAVADLFGTPTFPGERELLRSEVGLVASSVAELDRAVWLLRAPDAQAVDRWFPVDRRTAQADFGVARSFRMDDGLVVCEREGIVALARGPAGDSVILSTMYLMRGRPGAVLHAVPEIERARGYLPARPLATVYVADKATARTGANARASGATDGDAPPAVTSRAFVGAMYEADGGLDIAVRGTSASRATSPAVAPSTIERLLQLPRSTLVAVAHGVDWSELANVNGSGSPPGSLARYFEFLFDVAGTSAAPPPIFNRLGANVILAWDQNFQRGSTAPQLAVLIQADAAGSVASELRRAVARLIELVGVVDSPAAARSIHIEEATHLGNAVACAPLGEYARTSHRPLGALLANVEPCWSVAGDWVVVTLGRDHLERILDAQRGLAPSLSSMRDVGSLRQRRTDVRFAAIAQGELASEVLDEWLGGVTSGASLLAPGWWDDWAKRGGASRRRVGIGMRTAQEPGVVTVGRVYPDTAADSRLVEGDRIVGVDGATLDLENPNADLRSRIEQSRARPGPTLRVLRAGGFRDVVLPLSDHAGQLESLGMAPIDAAREVASVFRSIPFAGFVLSTTDDNHYAARLNVRFASESSVTEIPPE